jgi:hypothetical protein
MTKTRIATTMAMLAAAHRARDQLMRAQVLSETEYQLARAASRLQLSDDHPCISALYGPNGLAISDHRITPTQRA